MDSNKVKHYIKKQIQPMCPWCESTDMTLVSVSQTDKDNGSPKHGDMIAFNPQNLTDRWLVAERFFLDNYEEAERNKHLPK